MGGMVITASKAVRSGSLKLTSVVCTPSAAGDSAHCTLYNATAATANTEVMWFRCGSGAQTVTWNDPNGYRLDNLYVAVNCAFATVVWN